MMAAWCRSTGWVDHYDAARPGYTDELYDALEPLAGARVVEGGAGTGIATRALLARGARVVPVDLGARMLLAARARTSGLAPVVADGARWLTPARACVRPRWSGGGIRNLYGVW
jgi:trans-aconitate methyltransferase